MSFSYLYYLLITYIPSQNIVDSGRNALIIHLFVDCRLFQEKQLHKECLPSSAQSRSDTHLRLASSCFSISFFIRVFFC